MFGAENRCIVVVGAQWGDEGKGKIVDALAENADMVVRYQGGANAGHTVIVDSEEFVLHQVPSGILHDSTHCVVGNGVVLDPETLVTELDELEARGISLTSRLHISDRAHLVLPYHKLIEKAAERRQKIGTTGRGIGPAYEDKISRRGIRIVELRDRARLVEHVGARIEAVNHLLSASGAEERAVLEDHVTLVDEFAERILPLVTDTGLLVHNALKASKNVLLEGAQGALLDVDHGTYPFVTSSNTTAGGAAVGAGIGPTAIDSVLGIVKAYITRVGNGPLPTGGDDEIAKTLQRLGGEFGATTGRPRRCGWYDAAVVRYSARINGLTDLVVTKLDVLDSLPEIQVCTGYRIEGKEVPDLPADAELLSKAVPILEKHEGWESETGSCRSLAELPARARSYLDRLEELAGVPTRYVSVGSSREQLILVG